MEVFHDPEADAVYIRLRDTQYAQGKELSEGKYLLYDKEGNLKAVEFLSLSDGVDLDGIPEVDQADVSALLDQAKIKIRSAA